MPLATLDNPFPAGLIAPTGSSLGILTGVGGNIDFIDQNKGAPQVHQYAIDVQRQLRGDVAVSLGYIGSTGRDIGYGGFTNTRHRDQPDRSGEPAEGRERTMGCGGAAALGAQSVLRRAGNRRARHQRDHPRRPAAAAVPAVQQRDQAIR